MEKYNAKTIPGSHARQLASDLHYTYSNLTLRQSIKRMDINNSSNFSEDQLSIKKVISLIFIPGILLLCVFVASSILLKEHVPVYLCLLLSISVTIIPFEIAVIVIANKKQTGRFGIRAAFKRHVHVSMWKIVITSFVLFGWAGLMLAILRPIENSFLFHSVFSFVPDFFYSPNYAAQLATFPKWMIALTCIFNLILNGIFAPIVEELYFRGYLMSRMDRLGIKAPLIMNVLFSLYHLFTPWENLTRIVIFLPLHYSVWKEKNLYIGMLTHCLCNSFGAVSMFGLLING